MILHLPRDARITVRDVTPALRSIVQRVDPIWQGDRVSVTFTSDVRVELASADWARLADLSTGLHEPVDRTWSEPSARLSRRSFFQIAGTIASPKALIVFRPSRLGLDAESERRADVVVHLDDFTTDAGRISALEVARDAYLSRDIGAAQRIAKEALPWCHGLFLVLLAKEEKVLKAGTR